MLRNNADFNGISPTGLIRWSGKRLGQANDPVV